MTTVSFIHPRSDHMQYFLEFNGPVQYAGMARTSHTHNQAMTAWLFPRLAQTAEVLRSCQPAVSTGSAALGGAVFVSQECWVADCCVKRKG